MVEEHNQKVNQRESKNYYLRSSTELQQNEKSRKACGQEEKKSKVLEKKKSALDSDSESEPDPEEELDGERNQQNDSNSFKSDNTNSSDNILERFKENAYTWLRDFGNDKLLFFLIVLPVFGAIALIYFVPGSNDDIINSDNSTRLERFRTSFVEIRAHFPSQNSRLWQISRFALETNLKSTENTYPAVLMLLSTKRASSTMQCLAEKLSDAFSLTCGKSVKVNGSKYENDTANKVKHEIDRTIESGHAKGACSVVISRFEALPPFATTIFFQYCENDNAPFKNFAVIFTVQVDDGKWNEDNFELSDAVSSQWDRLANYFLKWSLVSRDSQRMTDELVSALLSRITSSVVWVKQEEKGIPC